MHRLPEIANLPLQPLEVPGGWNVIINHFYQLDPDDDLSGRQILHFDQAVVDPWDDVLYYYFDHSSLWRAKRNDNRCQFEVEWSPMGQRDGRFIILQHHSLPIAFSNPPKGTLKQRRDETQITYDLNPPVTWSETPERTFESRDRNQIALKLNEWLAECSRDWS